MYHVDGSFHAAIFRSHHSCPPCRSWCNGIMTIERKQIVWVPNRRTISLMSGDRQLEKPRYQPPACQQDKTELAEGEGLSADCRWTIEADTRPIKSSQEKRIQCCSSSSSRKLCSKRRVLLLLVLLPAVVIAAVSSSMCNYRPVFLALGQTKRRFMPWDIDVDLGPCTTACGGTTFFERSSLIHLRR
jgi:hypothetical protein